MLTIDRHIQRIAGEALWDCIGSVVVLKPATGEVLAMVSRPSFNPTELYGSGTENAIAALRGNDEDPFLNRVIQSPQPRRPPLRCC